MTAGNSLPKSESLNLELGWVPGSSALSLFPHQAVIIVLGGGHSIFSLCLLTGLVVPAALSCSDPAAIDLCK